LKKYYKITSIIFILVAANFSCSAHPGLYRETVSLERPDISIEKNRVALIRSVSCDIYIEPFSHNTWKKILKSDVFLNNEKKSFDYRIPELLFFQIIISNTGKQPLTIRNISIRYDSQNSSILRYADLRKRLHSPFYSIFNFKRILSQARLTGDKFLIQNINYDKDTLVYKMNHITPSDSIVQFIAFDKPPSVCKKYKILVELSYAGSIKTFDFDFRLIEYRSKGEHFLKPAKKTDILWQE